jgi:hypothetical protein
MRNACSAKVFCSVANDDLFTPTLRILLNASEPKTIRAIKQNYAVLGCETQAVAMMKDEDSGVNIKLSKEEAVTKPAECSELDSSKKGKDLLGNGIKLNGGTTTYAGPNVDITKRDAPTKDTKHQGVHTVHRLYMAAAFRLLLGGANVNQNTGVAALVVSPNGQILSWGKKSSNHRMLHAETSALIAYRERLPKGARIYTTLMPCRMCRALIEHFSTGGDFLADYGQVDLTRATAGPLDHNKFLCLSNPSDKNPDLKPQWMLGADKNQDPQLKPTISGQLAKDYDVCSWEEPGLGNNQLCEERRRK